MAAAPRPDGKIELAGCWTDIVTDPGFRVAVYEPVGATWTLRRGHGPFVDPIAGMAGPNGAIYWFSQRLRIEDTAVFSNGYRVVVEIAGQYVMGAAAGPGAASDAAVLGPDGRVYAMGGWRNCQPEFGPCPVRPVRAWQPLPNSWGTVSRLPTPRIRVAAAIDSRGRIFVMGGISGDGSAGYTTVEVYRTASGSWRRAPDLTLSRMDALATATPDGRVWLIGGYATDSGSPVFDGEVYTPGG
jgi:Kelch motif.